MLKRYWIPALTLLIAIFIGALIQQGYLSWLMGLPMVASVLVMGLLLQIIVLMHARINALELYNAYLITQNKGKNSLMKGGQHHKKQAAQPEILQSLRGSHEKEHPAPAPVQVNLRAVLKDLRQQEAFSMVKIPITDLENDTEDGYFARLLFRPQGQGETLDINRLIVEETTLPRDDQMMMIFARLLFVLQHHCLSSRRVLVEMPLRLVDNPLLATSLARMAALWSKMADRLVCIFNTEPFMAADQQTVQHLEILQKNGVQFALNWHESLFTMNPALLKKRGVRVIVVRFDEWISLCQAEGGKEKIARFSARMQQYDIAWAVHGISDLTPNAALQRQGVRFVISG